MRLTLCIWLLIGGCATHTATAQTNSAPESTLRRLSISLEPAFGLDTKRVIVIPPGDEDELSTGSTAVNLSTVTSRTSFQIYPVVLRYRSNHATTLSAYIPYVVRTGRVELNGNNIVKLQGRGLGDVQIGLEHLIGTVPRSAVSITGEIIGTLPTGKSAFNTRVDELPVSNGLYQVNSAISVQKISDPIVATTSIGLNYSFARKKRSIEARPGLGYNLQTGIGYALSDQLILSEQLLFTRRPNVLLLLRGGTSEKTDEAYLTHSIVYTPNANRSYRLALTVGLNESSTDYILSISAQQ